MVDKLKNNFKYEVKTSNFFSINEVHNALMLYQPIIKYTASSVYLTLLTECNYSSKYNLTSVHERLFSILGMSAKDFKDSIAELETVGLVRTFYKPARMIGEALIVYELYKPKDPKDFFDSKLLSSSLSTALSEMDYEINKSYFKMPKIDLSGFEDLTGVQHTNTAEFKRTSEFDSNEIRTFSPSTEFTSINDSIKSKPSQKTSSIQIEKALDVTRDIVNSIKSIEKEVQSFEMEELVVEKTAEVTVPSTIGLLSDEIRNQGGNPVIISSSKRISRQFEELIEVFKPELPWLAKNIIKLTNENDVADPDELIERVENLLKISNAMSENSQPKLNNNFSYGEQVERQENKNIELLRQHERDIEKTLMHDPIDKIEDTADFDFGLTIKAATESKDTKTPVEKSVQQTEESNIPAVDKMALKLMNMKNLTPEDYLEKRKRAPISIDEKSVIDRLLTSTKLNSDVINVVIDHNFNRNGYFNQNYSFKIGTTMSRKDITTAEEAIAFLKKAYDNTSKNASNKNQQSLFNPETDLADFGDIF